MVMQLTKVIVIERSVFWDVTPYSPLRVSHFSEKHLPYLHGWRVSQARTSMKQALVAKRALEANFPVPIVSAWEPRWTSRILLHISGKYLFVLRRYIILIPSGTPATRVFVEFFFQFSNAGFITLTFITATSSSIPCSSQNKSFCNVKQHQLTTAVMLLNNLQSSRPFFS
jgi:hypothetical protein